MSHFYGLVQGGAKTPATRWGAKDGGIMVWAASWVGRITITLYHDEKTGKDHFQVDQVPHHGAGVNETLARGVVGEKRVA